MLAYDYPILGLFWTMLIFFIWVAWIILVFRIFIDLFRSPMGGFSKALWVIVVILIPFLGVLIYLIANGHDMAQRNIEDARQSEAAMQSYIRETAGTGTSNADELSKLADLHAKGTLTDEEFAQQKAKLLS